MTAALVPGLTYAAYDALPGLRWSALRWLALATPMHFRHHLTTVRPDSTDLRFGRFVHKLILGGDEIFTPIADRRLKVNRDLAEEAKAAGNTPIAVDDWDAAIRISRAVRSHPEASALLFDRHGANELSVTWEQDGVECKARLDRLIEGAIIELKTARDASPVAMTRQARKFGYHGQFGCYLTGLDAVSPRRRECVIIAVEKTPPFAVGVYTLTQNAVEQGRDLFHLAIARLRDCEVAGHWPGYPTQDIDFPMDPRL